MSFIRLSLGGAPCIMAKLDARFQLDYMSVRHGIRTVSVDLPAEPSVGGSCIRGEGDTAVLTMHWSVFNFSLVYTQNPEAEEVRRRVVVVCCGRRVVIR